jgi:hypothetical protein
MDREVLVPLGHTMVNDTPVVTNDTPVVTNACLDTSTFIIARLCHLISDVVVHARELCGRLLSFSGRTKADAGTIVDEHEGSVISCQVIQSPSICLLYITDLQTL